MRYWIMGGGGIGRAIAEACLADGHQVLLFSRRDPCLAGLDWRRLDGTDDEALEQACAEDALPERVINTLGMLHQQGQQPEKRIEHLSEAALLNSIHVNTWPTLAMGRLLSRRLGRHQPLRFAALSARVGSISDNRAGGWYSYRISKAALNMATRLLAHALASRGITVVAVSPGWVRTDMGGPEAPLAPDAAVAALLRLVDGLGHSASGGFLGSDGTPIAW